jgi:hypothetical protein
VAVDPTDWTIYLVTKALLPGCRVYAMPWPRQSGDAGARPFDLRPATVLSLTAVTSMDIAPDGRHAVVLTYAGAYEYSRSHDESWPEAFGHEPRPVHMAVPPQAEAICYSVDGRTLHVTGEGRPALLVESPAQDSVAQ